MMGSARILFIHYYFPPVGTVGSLRNYHIAREISPFFEKSDLLTVRHKPFRMKDPFDDSFLSIQEIARLDYRYLYEMLGRKGDLNDQINAKRAQQGSGFLRKLTDSFPGNLIWGEGGAYYVWKAVQRASRLVHDHGITHVYSSFRPFTDHIIAYQLKGKFPHLRWIADFRDLPVDRNRDNVFFPKWTDRQYKRILTRADILTTVSKGLKEKLIEYNDRVMVVRNGLRADFIPGDIRSPDKFTLSYTGSIYPGMQDPVPLFRELTSLLEDGRIDRKQICLQYAGKDHRIWGDLIQAYGLEDISVNHGKVDLSQAIRIQHESHVNLLFSWSGPFTGGVLTGKIYEYLAAGKAILCLVKGNRDKEIEEIVGTDGIGRVFYSQGELKASGWLQALYEQWQSGTLASGSGDSRLEKWQWGEAIKPLRQWISANA